jgi:UDP-N-acetyl-D-mannosaminuronic acid dehydrogenase
VVRLLKAAGFSVRAFDPYVATVAGLEDVIVQSVDEAIEGVDAVVVLTDHREFRTLSADDLGMSSGRYILDTRHCLRDDSSVTISRKATSAMSSLAG